MGDKDALKLLQEKLRKTLSFQERVKAELAASALEKEERERQEQG